MAAENQARIEALVAERTRELERELAKRTQVEEALARTARDWQTTFDAANDAIWLLDKEQRVVRSNRMADEMFQHPCGGAVGHHCWAIAHGTTEPIPQCPIQRARTSLRRESTELQIGARWFEVTGDPILDAAGQFAGAVHIVSDITERRQAQAALKEQEAMLRRVLEALPVGVWIADAKGTIARANEAGQRIWAGPRYVGVEQYGEYKGWWAATGKRIEPEEWAAFRAITKGETSLDEEIDIECFDGARKTILNSAVPLRDADQRITGAIIVNQDITERKRAEAARRESEDRFRGLYENAVVGFYRTTPEGRIVAANRALLHMLGYASLEELARRNLDQEGFEPDYSRAAFKERIEREGHIVGLEAAWRRRDGSCVSVSENCRVVRDESGRVLFYDGSVEDITERKRAEGHARTLLAEVDRSRVVLLSVVEDEKRAEAALSQLNLELERRVGERTAELLAANEELESFSYAVSHDLRAPLRAMSGFSAAVMEDFGASLPEEARGYLNEIYLAGQSMGQLIDGLLALSRATRAELRRDRVDLSALAERLCRELALAEPTRTVQWYVEDGLTAWGDARMLESVMSNLLGNAWKYTARCHTPSVRVYADHGGATPCYCVADNGAGFDMRHADRLFKPFQRLHRQDEFPGVGIGLATVRRVIRRHGGTLSATAVVGEGATFRFCLPGSAEHLQEAS